MPNIDPTAPAAGRVLCVLRKTNTACPAVVHHLQALQQGISGAGYPPRPGSLREEPSE
jgi:hypothetical protein